MSAGHTATSKGLKGMGIILMLVALFLASTGEGHARGGRHGGAGHHGGRRHHRFFASHVFIAPSVLAPFGPYWDPFWPTYAYRPVVVVPSTQVPIQPSPQLLLPPPPPPSWYYCENPPGYYPYVQQCPGGWRPVAPTPP